MPRALRGLRIGLAPVVPVEVVLGQLGQEAAGLGLDQLAVALAPPGQGEGQRLAGAGDADVGEPALLLDGVLLDAGAMGQQLLLHADQEDVGELQPLGGVQGHQVRRGRRPSSSSWRSSTSISGEMADHLGQGLVLQLALVQCAQPVDQVGDVLHAPVGDRLGWRRSRAASRRSSMASTRARTAATGSRLGAPAHRSPIQAAKSPSRSRWRSPRCSAQAQLAAGGEQADPALAGHSRPGAPGWWGRSRGAGC